MANWNPPAKQDPAVYEAEQAERVAVFNKIADKANWKKPIDAKIDEADLAECEQAAIWFTGGPIKVIARWPRSKKVTVWGGGYYQHIGA